MIYLWLLVRLNVLPIFFMVGNKLILSAILGFAFLAVYVSNTFAAVIEPNFTSCVNPQGSIRASHTSGTHGVAGDTNTYTGVDTVYTLNENTYTQCLCTDNGQGIQTNWWNVSSLTQKDLDIFVNQGWIFIQNGSAWGLDSAPYLAKSSNFVCNGTGGDSSSNSSDGGTGGPVAGSSSSIDEFLNLASTGNKIFILLVIFTGISLLSLGLILNLKKS